MSQYVLNGKEVTREEMLDYVNDPNIKITHFSQGIENEKSDEDRGPCTNEGFAFTLEQVAGLSKDMDDMNAAVMKLELKNSRKVMGKTVILFMTSREDWRSRLILWLIDKIS
jgi:hypothetical protein